MTPRLPRTAFSISKTTVSSCEFMDVPFLKIECRVLQVPPDGRTCKDLHSVLNVPLKAQSKSADARAAYRIVSRPCGAA